MYISHETAEQTEHRLLGVLRAADFEALDGTYAFVEFPRDGSIVVPAAALACVGDQAVWSVLVPSTDASRELFRLCRFHFRPDEDNSGFVGWIASHLKRTLGTGVFVVCGQNSQRGGIFDYLGCPAALGSAVTAEIERLRSGSR